jgi:uncharacterized membrane protein YdjX (TVP38/TMEM64 family)
VKRLKKIAVSGFLWLLLGAIVLGVLAEMWVQEEGGLRTVVERWGIWGPSIGWIAKTATSMTPIGSVLLPVAFGALFDPWTAIFLNVTSGVVAGTAMYGVWRRGNHEFDLQSQLKTLPTWFRVHQADNLFYLIALRQLPWAGGSLADLLAGAHKVPLRTQILSLLIGNLPGAVLYTLIGKGLWKLG